MLGAGAKIDGLRGVEPTPVGSGVVTDLSEEQVHPVTSNTFFKANKKKTINARILQKPQISTISIDSVFVFPFFHMSPVLFRP